MRATVVRLAAGQHSRRRGGGGGNATGISSKGAFIPNPSLPQSAKPKLQHAGIAWRVEEQKWTEMQFPTKEKRRRYHRRPDDDDGARGQQQPTSKKRKGGGDAAFEEEDDEDLQAPRKMSLDAYMSPTLSLPTDRAIPQDADVLKEMPSPQSLMDERRRRRGAGADEVRLRLIAPLQAALAEKAADAEAERRQRRLHSSGGGNARLAASLRLVEKARVGGGSAGAGAGGRWCVFTASYDLQCGGGTSSSLNEAALRDILDADRVVAMDVRQALPEGLSPSYTPGKAGVGGGSGGGAAAAAAAAAVFKGLPLALGACSVRVTQVISVQGVRFEEAARRLREACSSGLLLAEVAVPPPPPAADGDDAAAAARSAAASAAAAADGWHPRPHVSDGSFRAVLQARVSGGGGAEAYADEVWEEEGEEPLSPLLAEGRVDEVFYVARAHGVPNYYGAESTRYYVQGVEHAVLAGGGAEAEAEAEADEEGEAAGLRFLDNEESDTAVEEGRRLAFALLAHSALVLDEPGVRRFLVRHGNPIRWTVPLLAEIGGRGRAQGNLGKAVLSTLFACSFDFAEAARELRRSGWTDALAMGTSAEMWNRVARARLRSTPDAVAGDRVRVAVPAKAAGGGGGGGGGGVRVVELLATPEVLAAAKGRPTEVLLPTFGPLPSEEEAAEAEEESAAAPPLPTTALPLYRDVLKDMGVRLPYPLVESAVPRGFPLRTQHRALAVRLSDLDWMRCDARSALLPAPEGGAVFAAAGAPLSAFVSARSLTASAGPSLFVSFTLPGSSHASVVLRQLLVPILRG